jgi:transcriptional regulator
MYIPKHFEAPDHASTIEVMRGYPFAMLISTDAHGSPMATPLPVAVSDSSGETTLHFHVARANPHAKLLSANARTMVAFSGPHAYMSPSVYPDLKRVPTWNYIAVHAYGELTEVLGDPAKDDFLKFLIGIHEPTYADQWRALDAKYQTMMMSAICAFQLRVTRLESKFKINQHRTEAHASMKAIYATGNPDEQALGVWMERLGL